MSRWAGDLEHEGGGVTLFRVPSPITGYDSTERLVDLERQIREQGPEQPEPVQPEVVVDQRTGHSPDQRLAVDRRRARILKALVLISVLILASAVSAFAYVRWRVGQIDRVQVSQVLAPTPQGGPTWLIVGSDSRDGIDPDRPDAGGLLGEVVTGQRADTIILLRHLPGVGPQMLSLPRDLWLDPPGDNNATRINGAYNRGAEALIVLIDRELGIEVNRYAEVDLAGLDAVVDSVGGVTIDIAHPGYDNSIGLRIEESGQVKLDGATALAYVRTRNWTEIIDGVDVLDGTGDLGRNQRQQRFLSALGSKLGSIRNPFALNSAASGIAESVRVDDGAGFSSLYSLARMIQNATQAEPLPVVDHITGGGASVLLLGDGADEVLDQYR